MSINRLTLILMAVTVTTASSITAQQPGATRVTLVSGPATSRGGRTEVVRQANRTPRNVVIVDRSATPDDLAAALAMLNALRIRHGDSLSADIRARPRSVRSSPTWQTSAYRQWLVEQLVRLRRAPEVQVPFLGVAKTVEITLPSPAGTVSGPSGKH